MRISLKVSSCLIFIKNNTYCYKYNFETSTVQTIQKDSESIIFCLLCCMNCILSVSFSLLFVSVYSFASYPYSSKILQPYVAAAVRMSSDAVSGLSPQSLKLIINNKWWLFINRSRFGFGRRLHMNQPLQLRQCEMFLVCTVVKFQTKIVNLCIGGKRFTDMFSDVYMKSGLNGRPLYII